MAGFCSFSKISCFISQLLLSPAGGDSEAAVASAKGREVGVTDFDGNAGGKDPLVDLPPRMIVEDFIGMNGITCGVRTLF